MEIDDEMKVMKITNKQVVEECMARIEQLQEHIKAVEAAAWCLRERKKWVEVDYGNLHDLLISEELEEWRNLALWGMTLDDAERDRVKAAAHQRFLDDGQCVGTWMNNGVQPSSWLVSDEEKFRAMAKKAFGPKR